MLEGDKSKLRIRVNTCVSDFTLLTHTVVGGFDTSLSSREDTKKAHGSDVILRTSKTTSQSSGESVALLLLRDHRKCLMYEVRPVHRGNIHSNTGQVVK